MTNRHGRDGRERARAGFSLIEMLIAMTVLTVVMAAALGVFRTENDALAEGVERLEVLQNVRFGANAVEKDLKTAGSHVPRQQPTLLYADEDVIAFNADFTTNVAGNGEAVYYDPDAPNEEVRALTQDRQITIPNSTFAYPQRDYQDDGSNSPAETIVFFFTQDSSTARSDDWALFRQVNDQEPQLVSRHLLRSEGSRPFLEYEKLVAPDSAPERIETMDPGELPVAHTTPTHLGSGDDSPVDSIRAVRLQMAATNGKTGDQEEIRTVSRTVRIPNAGIVRKRVCGSEPKTAESFNATPEVHSGSSTILLEWDASVDQASGEEDVVRYLVWKRHESETDWGPPILALPVGDPSYSYRDAQVTPNEEYHYGVAAQDCTPELSPKAAVGPVEAPDPATGGGGSGGS